MTDITHVPNCCGNGQTSWQSCPPSVGDGTSSWFISLMWFLGQIIKSPHSVLTLQEFNRMVKCSHNHPSLEVEITLNFTSEPEWDSGCVTSSRLEVSIEVSQRLCSKEVCECWMWRSRIVDRKSLRTGPPITLEQNKMHSKLCQKKRFVKFWRNKCLPSLELT